MIVVYAAAYGPDGGDWRILGMVESAAAAEALCAAYVAHGRLGADRGDWGDWSLEWVEVTEALTLETVLALLNDHRWPEPRLHGDDMRLGVAG